MSGLEGETENEKGRFLFLIFTCFDNDGNRCLHRLIVDHTLRVIAAARSTCSIWNRASILAEGATSAGVGWWLSSIG